MNTQASNQIMRPIVSPPQHNYDNFKIPRQQQLEREYNLANDSAKKVVKQSIDKVYESFQRLVENTDYAVNYQLDESTGVSRINIIMKNSGNEVASIPPDVAVEIAERAKQTNIGLIIDFYK
ncbi:MAG: flagellar protein FlaG [Bacillota bacterium]|nr:flagellar protein FlaG [Bacillota bacterium]